MRGSAVACPPPAEHRSGAILDNDPQAAFGKAVNHRLQAVGDLCAGTPDQADGGKALLRVVALFGHRATLHDRPRVPQRRAGTPIPHRGDGLASPAGTGKAPRAPLPTVSNSPCVTC